MSRHTEPATTALVVRSNTTPVNVLFLPESAYTLKVTNAGVWRERNSGFNLRADNPFTSRTERGKHSHEAYQPMYRSTAVERHNVRSGDDAAYWQGPVLTSVANVSSSKCIMWK